MSSSNSSAGRSVQLVRRLAPLALAFASLLTGCTTMTLHPVYQPSEKVQALPASGIITLRVLDKIDNSAPLARQLSLYERISVALDSPFAGAAVSHTVDTGQLLVSEAGPYKLDEPAAVMAARLFREALGRSGLSVVDDAPDVLELQLLRFEFILGTRYGETKMNVFSTVLLKAAVRHSDQLVAETTVLEQGEQGFGLIMTAGDIEGFVSKTLSRAAERTVRDEQFAGALNGPRSGAK